MPQTVTWLPMPERHDYQAAEDYLSLIMSPGRAAEYRRKLSEAKDDITHRKAKDMHVASDLAKAASGMALSPILLLRGTGEHPLIIADGYHRVCASYWIDENTDIPCVLV